MARSKKNPSPRGSWWARFKRPPEPESFRVRCRCGTFISGQRTDSFQSPVCPACNQAVFVLPASPFPAPVPPAGHPDAALLRPKKPPRGPLVDRERVRAGVEAAHRFRKHWLSVPKLVILGAVLLVAGTLAWTWNSVREQRNVAILPEALAAGREAFTKGNVYEARRHLERAALAAQGLGRGTKQERTAIQLYREALAWSSLSRIGPDEVFKAAQGAAAAKLETAFAAEFKRRYGGQAIVVDTWISFENEGEVPGPRLEYVVFGDGYRGRMAIDGLPWISLVSGDGDRRVIFAGEFAGVERSPHEPDVWLLRFVPESTLLLTHRGPFQTQGWPDEGLDAVLAEQRNLLGLEP